MDKEELKDRTKKLSTRIMILADNLPCTPSGKAIAGQIVRSGASVGANYRAACLARSRRDFINKLKIVEEEADGTVYWLELIEERNLVDREMIKGIKREGQNSWPFLLLALKQQNQTTPDKA